MTTMNDDLRLQSTRAGALFDQDLRLRRAVAAMPNPVPWDWARSRLLPLLAGPYLGQDGPVIDSSPLGCAIQYALDVEGSIIPLDPPVMERWECSLGQLGAVGMANLEERASRLTPGDIARGVISGYVVKTFTGVPWAASLLLAPPQVLRLFGADDQRLVAPRQDLLVSLPMTMPPLLRSDAANDLESETDFPLMLGSFSLLGGVLTWTGNLDDDPADW